MKTALRAVLSVMLLTLPLSGCLELEEGLTLQPDLSGTAVVRVQMDMSGMIPFVAKMQKEMKGEQGEVTEAELAQVKKELLEKQEQDRAEEDANFAAKRATLESTLPEGVKLEAFDVSHDELKMSIRMSFRFDHVSKLPALELPADPEDESAPAGVPSEQKLKKPFENLVVEETPDQVTITFRPTSPLGDEKAKPAPGAPGAPEADGGEEGAEEGMPGMKELVEEMTKAMRVSFTVTTPLAVAESNETKKDGETLRWTFDKDSLTKLQKQEAGAPPAPRVVLRKQK